ncbi:hypothetical protein ACFSQQ_28630 [Mesorhizobium kowhaii]|uniref:hypothetical protein n=1 Tax=Mesorhizobium kowhaii TaxID=1300272 RepID=UPI0035E89097
MNTAKFSHLEMHQPGAVHWMSLHSYEIPEAEVPMALMQVIVFTDELPRWHMWVRKLRSEHTDTPGIDFLHVWSVEINHRANKGKPSALHILNIQLPFSLMAKSMETYRRGLD